MSGDKFRGCLVKVGYKAKEDAISEVLRQRRTFGAVRLTAYKCKYCKLYHVGHMRRNRSIS